VIEALQAAFKDRDQYLLHDALLNEIQSGVLKLSDASLESLMLYPEGGSFGTAIQSLVGIRVFRSTLDQWFQYGEDDQLKSQSEVLEWMVTVSREPARTIAIELFISAVNDQLDSISDTSVVKRLGKILDPDGILDKLTVSLIESKNEEAGDTFEERLVLNDIPIIVRKTSEGNYSLKRARDVFTDSSDLIDDSNDDPFGDSYFDPASLLYDWILAFPPDWVKKYPKLTGPAVLLWAGFLEGGIAIVLMLNVGGGVFWAAGWLGLIFAGHLAMDIFYLRPQGRAPPVWAHGLRLAVLSSYLFLPSPFLSLALHLIFDAVYQRGHSLEAPRQQAK